MENENLENIDVEEVMVPNDDMGDFIHALFLAGFSDEETDLVLDLYNDLKSRPEGEVALDEEMINLVNAFEAKSFELTENDLAVIKKEFEKRLF